jgi:signal transduction histidine kinase/ActR/RegA family two-component response regulator
VESADEKLQYHLRMEDLVLEVAGRFLAIRADGDEGNAIRETLEDVGTFLAVDMAYVFQLDSESRTLHMTHRWSVDGVSVPTVDVTAPLDAAEQWVAVLRAGGSHVIHDLDAMDGMGQVKASMREFGVRSVVAVPLRIAGNLCGWLGVASIQRKRSWSSAELKLLHFVAHSMGQTLRRQRDERDLQHSELRFKAFLEQNPDGMYVLELDPPMPTSLSEDEQVERILASRIVLCNQGAAAELGASDPSGVIGGRFDEVVARTFSPETTDVLRAESRTFIRNGYRNETPEAPTPMLDGSERWVTRAAHGVIQDGCLTTIWASSRDITQDKQARDERERLARRLQQAERLESIGMLAGGVAHDFNNLLLAILGNADLAAIDPSNTARVAECLGEVRRAGQRAAELTRQLLAFSQRQPTIKKPVDLNRLLGDVTRMLKRLLPETIELDLIPGHDLGTILADEAQMEQLVLNLCLNGRDAMPRGGRLTLETQNVRINGEYCRTHPWARPGRYVLLTVNDTGTGIREEDLEHIFEPFFTTKDTSHGTGLGLATCYGIVQQHEGMIQVYSEVGMGTTFKVYLPITEQEASHVGPEVRPAPPGGRETILLAEDESQVRSVATRILERAGYTVVAVADGGQAVEAFEGEPERFDLVLLDVVMPTINGREALRHMQGVRPDVPILFSSGYTGTVLDGVELQGLGSPVLHKPYDPDQLLLAVRQALDAAVEARQKA